jgi:hypothetical protein
MTDAPGWKPAHRGREWIERPMITPCKAGPPFPSRIHPFVAATAGRLEYENGGLNKQIPRRSRRQTPEGRPISVAPRATL